VKRYSSLQRRRKKRRPSQAIEIQRKMVRAVLILGSIILLIIFFFGDHGIYQLYRLRKEKTEIQKMIADFREKQRELKTEKNRLETDYEYIEKLARERYRMAKKGEKVYKVIPKTDE